MLTKTTLAAAFIAATALLAPAFAVPVTPQSTLPSAAPADGSLLVQVHRRYHHWHHCRRVCHGHLHWSRWRGQYVCHGHWHQRCH
jgi:hypothetical protein